MVNHLMLLTTFKINKVCGYGLLLIGLINSMAFAQELNLAMDNELRIENGFNPARPTVIFFGGGNCVNSWEGTEAWEK